MRSILGSGLLYFVILAAGFSRNAVGQDLPRFALVRTSDGAAADRAQWISALRRADGAGAGVGGLQAIQVGFRSSPCSTANEVLLRWTEFGTERTDLHIFVDGEFVRAVRRLPEFELPATNSVVLRGIAAGRRSFTVSGTGATLDVTTLDVLDEQPFRDPMFTECAEHSVLEGGGCEIRVSWTNPDPPEEYLLLIDGFVLDAIPVTLPGVIIGPLDRGEHCVSLVGFESTGFNGYLGCEVGACCTLPCGGPEFLAFVRGDCRGNEGEPTISSAIFLFNFLFLGGDPPPCELACDSNGDGGEDVSDGSYLLNFLFLGGPPPPSWRDGQPICELVEPESSCAQSHTTCQ